MLPGMLPPDTSFFTDEVIVYSPIDEQGEAGEPIDFDPDNTAGTTLAAMVTSYASANLSTATAGGEATGRVSILVTFLQDPGITAAGQPLRWTKHAGVALTTPLDFATDGPAIPPGGLATGCWAVDCSRAV